MDSATKRQARGRVVRAVLAAIVAVWGMVLASFGQLRIRRTPGEPPDFATLTEVLIALLGAVIVLIAGYIAARSFASALRLAMHDQTGPARSSSAAIVVRVVGYVITAFAVLSALDVPMGGLLLGGALTGVVVGIAAQQTLGNFFAGIVLLMVRPFSVGDSIVLRSGPLGGEYEGTVTEMSLYYVHLVTDQGPVALPNAGVLASAVGPGARSKDDDDEPPEDDPGHIHGGTPAPGGTP